MASLEADFAAAARRARETGGRALGTSAKLSLYALYKQAGFGDAPAAEPSRFFPAERLKWGAWHKQAGVSREQAMREYVAVVNAALGGGADGDGLDGEPSGLDGLEAALN
jgi:acyl-CoA-binding protein